MYDVDFTLKSYVELDKASGDFVHAFLFPIN